MPDPSGFISLGLRYQFEIRLLGNYPSMSSMNNLTQGCTALSISRGAIWCREAMFPFGYMMQPLSSFHTIITERENSS